MQPGQEPVQQWNYPQVVEILRPLEQGELPDQMSQVPVSVLRRKEKPGKQEPLESPEQPEPQEQPE